MEKALELLNKLSSKGIAILLFLSIISFTAVLIFSLYRGYSFNLSELKFVAPIHEKSNPGNFEENNIRIANISPYNHNQGGFTIFGTYHEKPKDHDIRLILRAKGTKMFWPQNKLQFNQNNSWVSFIRTSEDSMINNSIIAALVGNSGKVLFDYHVEVGKETGQYPAIKELTSDIVFLDEFN
jgi:hypothetical protein